MNTIDCALRRAIRRVYVDEVAEAGGSALAGVLRVFHRCGAALCSVYAMKVAINSALCTRGRYGGSVLAVMLPVSFRWGGAVFRKGQSL